MQQHPVPQNITSYQFRLVGDMTLKQFLELAAGVGLAWIIFSSNLNFLLKWTLGPLAGFLGFALAFVPIEDRPLDQWLINFIKSLYSPNQYHWKPTPTQLDYLTPAQPKPHQDKPLPPQPAKLEEYLQSLPPSPESTFDQAEDKYLDQIASLFGALGNKLPHSSTPSSAPLNLKTSINGVRIRQLKHPQASLPTSIPPQPQLQPKLAAMPVILPQPIPTTSSTPIQPKQKPVPKPSTPPSQPTQPVVRPTTPAPAKKPTLPPTAPAIKAEPTIDPVFAKDAIIPLAPEKPNLISGITLDKNGKILASVIIEILDSKNQSVRALKSNKLGQFFIATPLPDGIYQIRAEHDLHRFAIIKLEAKNEIIPPLKIQALG